MVKEISRDTKNRMEKVIEDFRHKLATVRPGRASTSLLDNISIEYYGSPTPLNQVATIHAPEASMLTVQPFDPSLINDIEKALRTSELGVNPSNDGKLIRIPIPPLTEERRKQMVKVVHEMAEDHKTALRNVRRDSNDKLKKALKDKTISEDEEKGGLDEVQKLTDLHVSKIGDLAKYKEHEILKVSTRPHGLKYVAIEAPENTEGRSADPFFSVFSGASVAKASISSLSVPS